MTKVPRSRLLVGLVIGVALLVGCGGGTSPPAKLPQVDPAVSALRLQMQPDGNVPQQITSSLQTSFTRAGFAVVQSPDADLVARVVVQQTEVPGLITIVRNGRRVVDYRYDVTVQLLGGGQILDLASASFEAEAGEADGQRLANIVRALSRSHSLVKYAKQQLSRRSEPPPQQEASQIAADAQQEQAAELQRRQDEEAWIEAEPEGCRTPQTLDACKAVQLYRARFPHGAHAEEAGQVLSDAEPALEELRRDENSWQKSGSEACVPGASRDACVGVEIYLSKFPAGLHSVEARQLMRDAGFEG